MITDDEINEFIRENYLALPPQLIADIIGRSETLVKGRISKMNLFVPKQIIQQRIIESRIKKGNIPRNKGRKMSEWMSKASIAKSAKTRFKKGQKIWNEKTDGQVVIRTSHKNRNEPPYKWIRISKAKWVMYHVHLWEKENGPVPRGFILVFKDRDTMNVRIDNLELISRKENMKRNTIHRYPLELKSAIRQVNKLKIKIDEKCK